MEKENANTAMDALGRQLALDQDAFFLEPFEFTWWLRGGEPGSPSDHLTLKGKHGVVKVTYIRSGFDPARQPPAFSETSTGEVHRDQAAALLQPLFASPLFRMNITAEKEGALRDGRKESWWFMTSRAEYSKTLFEPLPEGLEPLRTLCRKIAAEVAQGHLH